VARAGTGCSTQVRKTDTTCRPFFLSHHQNSGAAFLTCARMAPKKGVSFDDKRLRLLEIFGRAEVFTLKEIEKIGSKEKGIVEQTIKDVLQTLVDDGLVETDKIGAGESFSLNFIRIRPFS
jgi:hypothetical protein